MKRGALFRFLVASIGIPHAFAGATLDQLAAMQTVVRAELEGVSICPETLGGITPTALNSIPMAIESRIRENLDVMDSAERREFFSRKRLAGCSSRCRCGIYANWIGSDPRLEATAKTLIVAEKRAPLSGKKVAECARVNRDWVCRNVDFREFVAGAKEISRGSEK